MKSGKIGLLFLLVLVVLVSNNLILFRNFQTVRDHHASVARTHLILKEIGEIVSSVRELESVGRGYLLEQDPSFLRDLARAKDEVWSHFASLNAATRGKAEQTTALTEIRNLLEERIRLVDSNIDLARAQGTAGVARLNVVLTGKRLMDRLRIRLNSLVSVEEGALAARTAAVTRSSALVTFTLIASGVVNFLLALMAFWLVRRQLEYQARMIDEQRRKGWIQAGLAKVAQITAGQIQPRAVAEKTLDLISEILNVPAGNFFLYSGGRLKRFATCGGQTSEPEAMDVSYGIGESLIGAAAQRGERIQEVREVPDDYFPIASSLGSATPHNLVFVPLRFEERLLGVMELAMFHPLQGRERELLEQIQERVAVSMNSALARERQQELLEETQRQAEELQAQQEELRTSNEELEQQTSALLRSQEKLQTQQEELRQINEELEAQTRTLERQQAIVSERNTELERANQYKSEFLAKMSHELRTPLNSMLILSSLLQENKDGNLSEQQREFASTIHDAGSDLLTLINDILDLAKMEARKLVLRPQTFSIQSLCDQLNLQFGPLFTKKGLDFQVDLDPATPQAMFSDRQRIEQVLRNFTSNALKFTEKGQVRLQVRMAPDQADTLWFSVQDTGVGIPESQKLKIFEAFEQADGSISRKYGGTGLGLTISRELAGLLQGRIFVSSVENQGSTFTLEVPLRIKGVARGQTHGPPTPVPGSSPQPVSPAAVEAPPGPAAPVRGEVERLVAQALGESRGRTVLIVEDDLVFRRAAEDAARAHGFAPISVGDGETALDVLRQHLPSAILLDIKLPGVSGLSVLETVKQTPQWRHIPVHMISALEYQMSAMRLGAMGYLGKPASLDGVKQAFDRIEGILDKRVKHVLVVEDDKRQQTAVRELLRGPGVEIEASSTGQEALIVIKQYQFDCIIVDLTLPDFSGAGLLEAIHEQIGPNVPPIIVYTGRELRRDEEDLLRSFSESIIIKGAKSPERLLDEVNLFLHRVESELPDEQRTMLSHLRMKEKSFAGRRVLLVDDDMRNIFALTSALESQGLAVIAARNGVEGLEALEKHPDVDVVLMDIMMPKMNGFEAIRRIRQMNQFRKLPIIALTAKAMKGDHEQCIEAGANDYLPKPVNLMNLISVLRVWLCGKKVLA